MSHLKAALSGSAIFLLALTAFFLFASPGCACLPKWKAYVAAMKSDLRNLATAEDQHFADHATFVAGLPPGFAASTGVRLRVLEATPDGWRAVATHERVVGGCAIWTGRVAYRPVLDGVPAPEGEPACWGIGPAERSWRERVQQRLGIVERPRPGTLDSVPGAP